MKTAIAPRTTLYDRDFYKWVQETTEKLKAKDFDHVDLEHLIEEIESLGTSERSEIYNRLATLLEHLLKRMFVDMPQEFNGWENTIREQRKRLKRAFKLSPSLKNYFAEIFDEAFVDALEEIRKEKGYKSVEFPDTWQFKRDIDSMLNVDFWE
ncbi:DUF29 domain-containing protein [Pseudanabaena mucicola]|uniref:DUF29 domain-containing protein n=1 Tax=Pseudanabaena mucicola FACHB-723 TaxID=2692860 RepID=A0ABR7ZT39_9CYAN|nr:DUF29 domain-containing protein [Pseudanabaena mucicola]MBD2186598.1 DUF29 domain-containing protein [Pseudanabaena mucicola FACHB-723]